MENVNLTITRESIKENLDTVEGEWYTEHGLKKLEWTEYPPQLLKSNGYAHEQLLQRCLLDLVLYLPAWAIARTKSNDQECYGVGNLERVVKEEPGTWDE